MELKRNLEIQIWSRLHMTHIEPFSAKFGTLAI